MLASQKIAVFFIQITVVLFMASETKCVAPYDILYDPHLKYTLFDPTSEDPSTQSSTVPAQNGPVSSNDEGVKCGPLRRSRTISIIPKILTPELISQSNPVHFLFDKLLSMSNTVDFSSIKLELNDVSNKKQLPQCYIPYAKALLSLVQFWYNFEGMRWFIWKIKVEGTANQRAFSMLPQRISSTPELFRLFSPDIFSDPQPPTRFFNELINLPNDAVQNMHVQLQSFVNEWMLSQITPFPRWYIRYANRLDEMIRNRSGYEEFKRDMDEIRSVAKFEGRFSET